MGKIIYVTGGVRSGKSSFAEKKVLEFEKKKIYVATGIPFDEEMKQRVNLHQLQRGKEWNTVEAYKNIPMLLSDFEDSDGVVLLDCLTNLVSNNLILDREVDWENISQKDLSEIENQITEQVKVLIEFIEKSSLDMVVVSNEVGMGIVPPHALGRYFRDISGRINQLVGRHAKEAYLIVSGLEMRLK